VVELDPARLETITVEALEKLLDENSYYLPAWAMKAFMDEYNGEFEGIGAYIMEQRGSIIIAEPMPGSPAEAAGLRPGDMIVSVDGTSMAGLTVDDAVRLIKGPAGTDVTLVIRRTGVTDPMTFTINRRQITVSSIRTQTFDDDIGYLNVQQFTDHTAENAQYVVDNFRAAGIDKLIIDLRGNPGGLLTEGVEFSRLFIPRGPIVHILYRDGMTTYYLLPGGGPF
jgi:carboxyl-terminal processing protease